MVIIQSRSKRKPTGGRYKSRVIKRLAQKGSLPILTKIGDKKVKTVRTIGGHKKNKLMLINKVNVYDPKSKKYVIATLETVVSNPANRHYVRRNILTKGTIIKTDKGTVKITNRPGQEANLNGVLIE